MTTARAQVNSGDRTEWELTVEPTGTGGRERFSCRRLERACAATGALCTAAGHHALDGPGQSIVLRGPAPVARSQQALAPLTAGFVSVPPEHDGETAFWLELSFNAAVEQGSKPQIRALLGASGGR